MDQRTKILIGVGLAFCLVIAILSPFIASGDPDGLEKSAEDSSVADSVEGSTFSFDAPMPDYTLGGEDNTLGAIVALIIGSLITIALGYGVAYIVKKN